MPVNARAFRLELDKANTNWLPDQLSQFTRELGLLALRNLIRRTPEDFGVARGGWGVGLGAPFEGTRPQGFGGDAALAEGTARIARVTDYTVIHISNNVKYIRVLDEGGFVPPDPGPSKDPRPSREGRILVRGGYSIQAPNGMVEVTLNELRPIVKRGPRTPANRPL